MAVRFQIFVSSTHIDLKAEREKVIYELTKTGFITIGMEQFHAADEEQMEYIRPLIDETDYYVVIVKGRYGSLADDGMSYTEKEYRYAREKGVPVLAFLYEDMKSIKVGETDDDPAKSAKLKAFRRELENSRMVSYWSHSDELVAKVKDSVYDMTRRKPRVGWVRGDQAMNMHVYRELEDLRFKNMQLHKEIKEINEGSISFPEGFAHGDDTYQFIGVLSKTEERGGIEARPVVLLARARISISWDEIFCMIVDDIYMESLEGEISRNMRYKIACLIVERENFAIDPQNEIALFEGKKDYIYDIRHQLQALGLITTIPRRSDPFGALLCWCLTEKGRRYISQLKAIRRAD